MEQQQILQDLSFSGATKNFGTVAAASVSANTSFAGFVMDNRGSGDIFTASSAGQTRLTLFQNGNVTIGNSGIKDISLTFKVL